MLTWKQRGLYLPIVTVLGTLTCGAVLWEQATPWRVPLLTVWLLTCATPLLLAAAVALPALHAWSGGNDTPAWMISVRRWGERHTRYALPLAHLLGCLTALLALPPLVAAHPALGVFAVSPWLCAISATHLMAVLLRRIAR